MPVLLRRHVVRSPNARCRQVHLLVQHFRNAEVPQLHLAVSDENVRSFKVAVQDALVMHVKNRQGYLRRPLHYPLLFYFSAPEVFLLLCDQLVKVATRTKLHNDIQPLSLFNGLLVADDVDVLELLQ